MRGTVVCDLDGVVYLGEQPIEGVGDALRSLEADGWRVLFATNNSARKPDDVVAKLNRVTGYQAEVEQVITSALVAASLIDQGPVLVMGESGIDAAVSAAGFDLTEDPANAATVIVGLDRGISYDRIARASEAVRSSPRTWIRLFQPRTASFPEPERVLPRSRRPLARLESALENRATPCVG